MAIYDSNHVKNIALLGHAGCGKTTFAESMLFDAGIIQRRGSIAARNTVSDYHQLETERQSSIFASLMHCPWKDYKINIIDTPGYDDFSGEVISALRVADTGVILLNAATGVEVGTDITWEYTDTFKTPTIFVINKLDLPEADFDKTLREARAHFGGNVVPVQCPVQTGDDFNSIVDLLTMLMYKFPKEGGKPEKLPIPATEKEKAEQLHKELIESIASND